MNKNPNNLSILAAALPLLLASAASYAGPITFAAFADKGNSQFVFSNNGIAGTGAAATFSAASDPIHFNFTSDIIGLDAALQGAQNAHLSYSISTPITTLAIYDSVNDADIQRENTVTTISILRDTPYKTFNNLLTVTFSAGTRSVIMSGDDQNSTMGEAINSGAGANAGRQNVTFTSDFLTFGANTVSKTVALIFGLNTGTVGINTNGLLNSFLATGTGSFLTNPVPMSVSMTVPEPGSATLLLAGLGLMGFTLRRRKTL